MTESSDGGFALAGETTLLGPVTNFWVLKVDSVGNLENCIRDLVDETSATITDTAANIEDTAADIRDLAGTLEDIDIELEDASPQITSQCGPNPDETLSLFEGSDLSDGVIPPGQSVRAVADTADPVVNEVTFRWISPSADVIREITVPVTSPEDIFAPDEPGDWIVEADFGNGQVVQKTLSVPFFVLPESPIGAIAILLSSLAALAIYVKLRTGKVADRSV